MRSAPFLSAQLAPFPRPGRAGRSAAGAAQARGGFTLVEVMIASIVLVLGITTAITTLQSGFHAVDTARGFTYASQAMQAEFERLRIKSWAQMEALQNSGDTAVTVPTVSGAPSSSFVCTRTIKDLKTDMKEVTLESTWRGVDGRPHTVRFVTRYGKNGLYDYFYTAH